MMRNLPLPEEHSSGVVINFEDNLSIDNLQGVATIKSLAANKINIGSAETVYLNLDAPNCSLELGLKSLH